jgi:hypothetical protein
VAGRRIACDEACDFSPHRLTRARVDKLTRLEKERNVPNVVQTKRYERTFHNTVDKKCESRLPMDGPVRESVDRVANRRPDIAQNHTRGDDGKSRDDRH